MGSILEYDLLAAELAARYRRETEHDRQLALLEAEERARRAAARQAGGVDATRRGLAGTLLGLAVFSLLRPRKSLR